MPQDVDVLQVGGFWPASMPVMLSPWMWLKANETVWIRPDGRLAGGLQTTDPALVEDSVTVVVPRPMVVGGLVVKTANGSVQPANGALTITVRKNGVDTALAVTVPANAVGPHSYSVRDQRVGFDFGERFSIKAKNLSPTADSAIVSAISFEADVLEPLR